MKKYLFSGLVGIILLVIAACGGDDKAAAPAAVATTAPAAPAAVATTAPAAKAPTSGTTGVSAALQAYADAHAGGPGSIFVGDYNQLVGDAPGPGLGGFDDEVSLESLTLHKWIYESDYYNSLPAKAKLTNPTKLVSEGEKIKFQHACINRTLLWCKLMEAYLVPNLLERTNGQVEMQISSFPELGLSGTDTMSLVSEGTLGASEIYGGYVGGEYPALEVQYLWGLWPTHEIHYNVLTSIFPDLEKVIVEATGAVVVSHNWIPGDDQFFFSDNKLTTLEDFKGLKTRSHSAALSDWIEGMGADAQFVAFSEVYTALERGILDAGVTGASPGFSQRWYEVTDYMNGRLISFNSTTNVINGKVWDNIPADLQAIIIEEGAKYELEALRIAGIQNLMGVARNVDAGLELVEFSEELSAHSFNVAALQHVVPAWINRVGGADHPAVKIFNKKIGPLVGVRIEADGSVTNTKTGSSQASISARLQAYADAHAGGPGAIYVGDLSQLVGPAQTEGQGGFDGGVPMASIEKNKWLFESDYYQEILKKAKLLNPTELTTSGEDIVIQHACINRALLPCQMVTETYGPGIFERTNGQLTIQITSFPELGVSGTDTISLVSDGVLGMANVYSGYVAGELPAIEIQSLWGMFSTQEDQYNATVAIHPNLEKLVSDAADGAIIVNHNWYAGIDQFFFCHDKLETLEDFKGVKARSHSAAISDWIEGMGADAQFVAFAEVYTALERGILDCGVTGADPAYGQRWYEVTKYMNGPLISFFSTNNVVNSDVWAKLPKDFQQIMLEEGAKAELEAHRVAAIQIDVGTEKNVRAGLEMVVFSEALQDHSYNVAVLDHVIPGWLRRLGGTDHPYVALFNEKIQPIVGLRIESDGSVTKTGVTKR
jgi:TRAP-type C4-dicarboxylate transport system substrate-binding protein